VKKNHVLLFGFAVLLAAVLIGFTGCSTGGDDNVGSYGPAPQGHSLIGSWYDTQAAANAGDIDSLIFTISPLGRIDMYDNCLYSIKITGTTTGEITIMQNYPPPLSQTRDSRFELFH
jgi:hypothetical protein